MAKDPGKLNGKDTARDTEVTDLRRYRREKERAAKAPPPRPNAPREPLLGANPRAGIILLVVVAVLALLYLAPVFL